MLTVHHLENSRSHRVIWLLEELGLDYEVVVHARSADKRESPPSLTRLHPLGKAPLLCDGEGVLAETGAIFEYLLERYGDGRLQPALTSPDRVRYLYWRHFAEATLMPYLAMKLVFAGVEQRAPWLLKPLVIPICRAVGAAYLNPNLRRALDFVEQHLAGHAWFAGAEFSAADVLIAFHLEAVAGRTAPVATHPHISAFVERVRARPAYQRAVQRGHWSAEAHAQYWGFLKG